jgi:hypothetical protein
MKHKKVWALPLAVLGFACFAFAGCDATDSTPATSDSTTDDSAQSEKVVITANTDPSTIVGEEVTAEQWNAAFTTTAFSNVSIKLNGTQCVPTCYPAVETVECAYKFMPTLIYECGTQTDSSSYYYFEEYRSLEYKYERSSYRDDGYSVNDPWEKEEISSEYFDNIFSGFANQFSFLVDVYSQFTYDTTQHAYVATSVDATIEDESLHFDNLLLKFVDGHIAYLSYSRTWSRDNSEDNYFLQSTMLFYDYGTTVVTIPRAVIEATSDS